MLLLTAERRGVPGGGKSGSLRGTRKSDKERDPACSEPVRASARATSPLVALENHLKPSKRYLEPGSTSVVRD